MKIEKEREKRLGEEEGKERARVSRCVFVCFSSVFLSCSLYAYQVGLSRITTLEVCCKKKSVWSLGIRTCKRVRGVEVEDEVEEKIKADRNPSIEINSLTPLGRQADRSFRLAPLKNLVELR